MIGGFVYRGTAVPGLAGRYFFGDFCTGRAWSMRWDGASATELREETASFVAPDGSRPDQIVAFGEDSAGELLVIDALDGQVFRVVASCGDTSTFCDTASNSTGGPALAGASGSLVVADNALLLSVSHLPTNEFGYFLCSDSTTFVPGFSGSQGNLCLGAPIVRFAGDVVSSGIYGDVTLDPDLSDLPMGTVFQPGETWYFQFWFRDKNPGQTSNTSNGIAVTFC